MELCKKIAVLINKNGRQGPRDIISCEVYGWVEHELGMCYQDYVDIITENAIKYTEREDIRSAFFVCNRNGTYGLYKSVEEEIRPYLYKIVSMFPGLTTSEIKERFKVIYNRYTYVDRLDQWNLNSPQDIIDQTVRNVLVSNRGNRENSRLFTRVGEKYYVADGSTSVFGELDTGRVYTKNELREKAKENKNFYAPDHLKPVREGEKYATDDNLRATCKSMAGYRCEVDKSHITFKTKEGTMYVEGHHIIPMAYQNTYESISLDCVENIIALCPNCHRRVHYGSKADKAYVLEKIWDKRLGDILGMGITEKEAATIFSDIEGT